jgi:hypothetical protein
MTHGSRHQSENTRNREFAQTPLSNWRTRSTPCTRAHIAASSPFVAAKQVIMCQGVMVREWYSMRCLGRAGSCRTCTGCTRNVLSVGGDCTIRTRQVLADVAGGTT